MSELKVLFVPTNVSGVVFYRTWQPYQAIREEKRVKAAMWWYKPNQYELHPWEWEIKDPEKGPSIVRDLDCGVAWADVVIWMGLHTMDSLSLFRKLKARHDKFFISEFDDYLFSIPPKNAAFEAYKPGSEPSRVGLEQMKLSDGVICSTPYLKDLYGSLNGNIDVVENVMDLSLWRVPAVPPVRQRVTIGWVGGATHSEDLEMVWGPIQKVLKDRPNAEFKCLHGIPPFIKRGKQVKTIKAFRPISNYPKWVTGHKFDIGIAPLVDNNFNRGKSNLRWLEYSSMRIPTVASPLPHFAESISHGETGFLAGSFDEWVEKLELLIDNADLRLQMGKAARQEVKERWSLKSLGGKYMNVIKGLMDAKSYEGRPGVSDSGLDQRPERLTMVGNAEAG